MYVVPQRYSVSDGNVFLSDEVKLIGIILLVLIIIYRLWN